MFTKENADNFCVTPVKPVEAFGGVIEDVILKFITEMQSQNVLQ